MRLFICDPVCVLPFGHNAVQLNYFKTAFAKNFASTIALCGKELPEWMAKAYEFTSFFEHYYDDFIRVDHRAQHQIEHEPLIGVGHIDRLESLATRDAVRLLNSYDIDGTDTVLYPGVDFYGLIGLLNALETWPLETQPRLLLRFLGIMETATHAYRDPVSHLVKRIREARERGANISFSAETPRLALMLSSMLDAPVLVTPLPELAEPLTEPQSSRFEVFCPGAARVDKGFLYLRDLFTTVRRADPELKIRFVTQGLGVRDAEHHQSYISQLYAIPGVELLESSITSEEMRRHYERCSAVLLPYDLETYRTRGSAILGEAACLARPAITIAGTAFAEQVAYYGLGTVAPSMEALPDAMIDLAKRNRRNLYRQALHARHRFLLDIVSAYENWFRPNS